MALDIEVNPGQLALVERTLRDIPRGVNTVLPRAINKTAVTVRSRTIKLLTDKFNLTQKAVRDRTTIKRATPRYHIARIRFDGGRISLEKFGGRHSRSQPGATAQIERGGSRKVYEKSFIATMASGHRGIFMRVTKARLPITELHGPSIRSIFEERLAAVTTRDAAQILEKNIVQQVQVILAKAGRSGSVDSFLGAMSERGGND